MIETLLPRVLLLTILLLPDLFSRSLLVSLVSSIIIKLDSTWGGAKQCKDIVGLLVPRVKKSDPNVKLKALKIINVCAIPPFLMRSISLLMAVLNSKEK